jgi:rhomboid protease GluP
MQFLTTIFFTLVMVIITLLYNFGILKSISCQKNFLSAFSRNFIHINFLHLFINLYAFYQLSTIELEIGSLSYFLLIILLALLQSIIELIVRSQIDLTCSIGFSGILYGLLIWTILSGQKTDLLMIVSVLLTIFASSELDTTISLSGHLIGVVSGILAVPIFSLFKSTILTKNY